MQPEEKEKPKNEEARKPYLKPAIIHELDIETRAGSPNMVDPINPFPDQ